MRGDRLERRAEPGGVHKPAAQHFPDVDPILCVPTLNLGEGLSDQIEVVEG